MSVSACLSSCDFNRLCSLCVAMVFVFVFFLIIKNTFTNKTQERKEKYVTGDKIKDV